MRCVGWYTRRTFLCGFLLKGFGWQTLQTGSYSKISDIKLAPRRERDIDRYLLGDPNYSPHVGNTISNESWRNYLRCCKVWQALRVSPLPPSKACLLECIICCFLGQIVLDYLVLWSVLLQYQPRPAPAGHKAVVLAPYSQVQGEKRVGRGKNGRRWLRGTEFR